MLLGTLGAILLGNVLSGWGINKKGKEIIRAGEEVEKSRRQGGGIVRAGYGNKKAKKIIKWIFNVASSFNKFWNSKISSKSNKI